jgi:hypothetical protein
MFSNTVMFRRIQRAQFYVLPTEFFSYVLLCRRTAIILMLNVKWLTVVSATCCVYSTLRNGHLLYTWRSKCHCAVSIVKVVV